MTVSVKAPTSTTGSIQLNGSDVLTIDSSGNLTAPNNLTVTGTVSSTGDVAFDTDTLYVDATNNRVGVGTSSPSYPLDVLSSTTDVVAIIRSSGATPNNCLQLEKTQGSGDLGNWNALVINGNDNTSYESRITWKFDSINEGPIIGGFRSSGSETQLRFYTTTSEVATERMRIDSNGYVFFGGTNTTQDDHAHFESNGVLVIDRAAANGRTGIAFFNGSTNCGNIILNLASTQYLTSSDYRLKENVAPMSGSIDRLKQLKPSTWSWKLDGSHGEGFLAHEAQEVVPESVHGTKDAMRTEEYEVTPAVLDDDDNVVTEAVMGTREVPDYQGIDQSKLVPLLTAALQEAITKIETLTTRIEALENI